MKQNTLLVLYTLCVIIQILLTGNCNKCAKIPNSEIILRLNKYLNSRVDGIQIKIDPNNVFIKNLEKGRYHITLKNSVIKTDIVDTINLFIKNLSTSSDISYYDRKGGMVDEIIYIYEPCKKQSEGKFQTISVKGFTIEGDFPYDMKKNNPAILGDFKPDYIRVSIGGNFIQKSNNKKNGTSETIKHLKLQLIDHSNSKGITEFSLNIEEFDKIDRGKEDDNLSTYMMTPNTPLPNLKKSLEEGLAIMDLTIKLGKIHLTMTRNGTLLWEGHIENGSYFQYLKPDITRKSYVIRQGFCINNLQISMPNKKEISLLSNLKELCFEYSITNLSPEAIIAFLDIMKSGIITRNQVENNTLNENEIMPTVTKFMIEVIKSKTQIHFKLSPVKHYFGAMKVEVDIRLYNLMAGPLFSAKITFFNINSILKKLKESNIFSTKSLKMLTLYIDKYASKKQNGNVSFIYEMDVQQMRAMFYKKNPMVPPTVN